MQDIISFITNHPYLFGAFGFVVFLLLVVEALRAKQNVYAIPPQKAVLFINHDNAQVIDIRPNEAFKKGHIIDAVSIPQTELNPQNKKLEKLRTRPLILVCSAGTESHKLAVQLLKKGYNIYSIAGGMRAWLNDQLPVVKE